jgi:phosphoribosylaminoimidazolecarboxamide formyltransferase/IMP cyclohydrolase
MFQNALVSVSDKTGLEDFLKPYAEKGMRIVSSGGTAQYLIDRGFEVTKVSEQTQFPEVMGGRVKTLHPNIHMPLLYRSDVEDDKKILKEHGLEPFDLVVVNLYPFASALEKSLPEREMVEFIDIGGPTLLRASAKNFSDISVVCDPSDYQWINEKDELTLDDRKKLSAKVFGHVSNYDSMISNYLLGEESFGSEIKGTLKDELRYGENPQQKAYWYQKSPSGLHNAEILQGKALSYNNLLDLDAALKTLYLFDEPTVISVKHNNPCGVATSESIFSALTQSLKADPVSVFGGIIASNKVLDKDCAEELSKLFLECIVAPGLTDEAKAVFEKKKNLRVLVWEDLLKAKESQEFEFRNILGGYLAQSKDVVEVDTSGWKVIGDTPTTEQWENFKFAWKVCSALKSNAIAVTCGQQSVGLGMGQVNRVDAVKQALERAAQFHPDKKDLYLASDAFFPFADSIELAAKHGVKAIIQPGGSVKDAEVIAAAEKLKIPMVLTGRRHFRH